MGKKRASQKKQSTNKSSMVTLSAPVQYWQRIYLETPLALLDEDALNAIHKILVGGKTGAKIQFSRRGECILHKLRINKKKRFVFASFENTLGRNLALVEAIEDHNFEVTAFYGEKNAHKLANRIADKVNRASAYIPDEAFLNQLETLRLNHKKGQVPSTEPSIETPSDAAEEHETESLDHAYFIDHKFIALNEEQGGVQEYLKTDQYGNLTLSVNGPPGSGKSTLAIAIPKMIMKQIESQLTYNQTDGAHQKPPRFLFVCKSKILSEEMAKIWQESALVASDKLTFDFLTYKELLKLQDPTLYDEGTVLDEVSPLFVDGKNDIKVLLKDGKTFFENWLCEYIKQQVKQHRLPELKELYETRKQLFYQEIKVCMSSENDAAYCDLGVKSQSLISKAQRHYIVEIKNKYLEYLSPANAKVTSTKKDQVSLQIEGKPRVDIKCANAAQFVKKHTKITMTLVDASLQTLKQTTNLFDAVFVDEGQDLSPHQLLGLRNLCDPRYGKKMIINRDVHQSVGVDTVIGGTQLSFEHQKLNLTESIRSPQTITALAQEILRLKSQLIGGQLEKTLSATTPDLKHPKYRAIYFVEQADELAKALPAAAIMHFKGGNRKLARIVMTAERKASLQQQLSSEGIPVSQQSIFTAEEIKGLEFDYIHFDPFHGKEKQWLKIYDVVKEQLAVLKASKNKQLEMLPHLTRFDHVDRELVILLNEFYTAITRTKVCLVITQAQDDRLKELYHYLSACIDEVQENSLDTPWGTPEVTVEDWRSDYKRLIKQGDPEAVEDFSKQLKTVIAQESNLLKQKSLKDLLDDIERTVKVPQLIKHIKFNQEQKIILYFQDHPRFDLTQPYENDEGYKNYLDYLIKNGEAASVNIVKTIALHAKEHIVDSINGTSLLEWMVTLRVAQPSISTLINEVLAEQVQRHGKMFIARLFKVAIERQDPAAATYIFSWLEKNITDVTDIVPALNETSDKLKTLKKTEQWKQLIQSLNDYLQIVKSKNKSIVATTKVSSATQYGVFSNTKLSEAGLKYLKDRIINPLCAENLDSEKKYNLTLDIRRLLSNAKHEPYFLVKIEIDNKETTLKDRLLNTTDFLYLCYALNNESEAMIEKIFGWKTLLDTALKLTKIKDEALTQLYYFAVDSGQIEKVRELVKLGVSIDGLEDKPDGLPTPLCIAAQKNHEKIVNFLIENKANVNSIINGKSPLYLAAQNGHTNIVKILIEKGANVNRAVDKLIARPLHVAAQNGYIDIVKLLIEKNANINATLSNGATPLYLACQNGYHAIVTLLLEKGGDMSIASNDGVTPLYRACQNGYVEIVKTLLEKTKHNLDIIDVGPELAAAIRIGSVEISRLLVEYRSETKAQSDLSTPLYLAVLAGRTEIVDLLLDYNAEINTHNNKSPLLAAIIGGHIELVKKLIEKKADVNQCLEKVAHQFL